MDTFNSTFSSIFYETIPKLSGFLLSFSEYLSNKEFDEKKVIEELKIEEEF